MERGCGYGWRARSHPLSFPIGRLGSVLVLGGRASPAPTLPPSVATQLGMLSHVRGRRRERSGSAYTEPWPKNAYGLYTTLRIARTQRYTNPGRRGFQAYVRLGSSGISGGRRAKRPTTPARGKQLVPLAGERDAETEPGIAQPACGREGEADEDTPRRVAYSGDTLGSSRRHCAARSGRARAAKRFLPSIPNPAPSSPILPTRRTEPETHASADAFCGALEGRGSSPGLPGSSGNANLFEIGRCPANALAFTIPSPLHWTPT